MVCLSAIADPTRRRIVELLAAEEYTAGEIVEEFEMSAPAISQHLNVLRKAKLITVRAEGQRRVYALRLGGLAELDSWLHRLKGLSIPLPETPKSDFRAEFTPETAIVRDVPMEIIKMEMP